MLIPVMNPVLRLCVNLRRAYLMISLNLPRTSSSLRTSVHSPQNSRKAVRLHSKSQKLLRLHHPELQIHLHAGLLLPGGYSGELRQNLHGGLRSLRTSFYHPVPLRRNPAQWQSGLAAEPDFIGGHDWVRFYAAPFGWIYADPSYGIGAVRAENEERRRFYFGNLDPYRMVANRAFQAPFTVEKKYWRTDPYDNQLGEIETAERGLMYEEFERRKEALMCEEIEEN